MIRILTAIHGNSVPSSNRPRFMSAGEFLEGDFFISFGNRHQLKMTATSGARAEIIARVTTCTELRICVNQTTA
jgi:hypothetical protein